MSSPAAALVVVLLVSGMLAMGTLLRPAEIAVRLRTPRPILYALLANLVVVPAVAVLLVALLPVTPAVALGVVLVGAAPGGGTGALLAHHARGDAAHAVVLQGLLAIASLLSTPVWFAVYVRTADVAAIDVRRLVVALLLCQLAPLVAGSALRVRRPADADRVHAVARRVADASLVLLVVGLAVTEGGELVRTGTAGLLAVAALVATTALVAAPSVGPAPIRRATLLTTVVRNLSMALLVAATTSDAERTVGAILSYGLLMYVGAGLLVLLARRLRSGGRVGEADLQSAA